ncbi:hypothetical protein RN001_003687 [Aquatica leii]|uniref:Regulatory protein zeste n=1 Tax=Aquatica leii TaxID=1421715 RepID=A0AAN7SE70_9COLE|nr:hypothetical protein RN001_003687 [Aquatica leii]
MLKIFSVECRNSILDFAEKYPQIITNKFMGPKGREQNLIIWNQLTTALNSIGLGQKTKEEWKKTLMDWKSKTKSKAGLLTKEKVQTGGGPTTSIFRNEHEERLLNIMGKSSYEGNPTNLERGFRKRKLSITEDMPQYEALRTGRAPPPKVADDVLMSIVSDAAPFMDVISENCFDSTAVFEDEVVKEISEPQSIPSTSSCLNTAKTVRPVKLLTTSNKRKRLYATSSDEATLRSDRIKKMMQNDIELHRARMEVINIVKEKATVDLELSKLELKLLQQQNIL